jgi:hypothetical protein
MRCGRVTTRTISAQTAPSSSSTIRIRFGQRDASRSVRFSSRQHDRRPRRALPLAEPVADTTAATTCPPQAALHPTAGQVAHGDVRRKAATSLPAVPAHRHPSLRAARRSGPGRRRRRARRGRRAWTRPSTGGHGCDDVRPRLLAPLSVLGPLSPRPRVPRIEVPVRWRPSPASLRMPPSQGWQGKA